MALDYSVDACKKLAEEFRKADVIRPMRVERYDAGDELTYEVTGVFPARRAMVSLVVEKFVGGGFAGQVYRVQVLGVDSPEGDIEGLETGGRYAMKILRPPSRFSQAFRDSIYAVGFQSPFSLQVNPDASRAGALWQKFIRRAAQNRFEDNRCVVDILATFVDDKLGSCGELSEWVDGRTWRFEVDDHLQERSIPAGDLQKVYSPEYRAKKRFMREFVHLLHDVGAHEFARQYEWWTCKSQPNALKRSDTEADPYTGLTAVDFRAGLALLPFLPMSPGDIPLILKGLLRGSLVQFDRGSLKKLRRYMDEHPDDFADMEDAFRELQDVERKYRRSMPDITHNHVKLLTPSLWGDILDAQVTSWRIRGKVDEQLAREMEVSWWKPTAFSLLGLLGPALRAVGLVLLVWRFFQGVFGDRAFWDVFSFWTIAIGLVLIFPLPAAARFARTLWGRLDLRKHYRLIVSNGVYLRKALRAHNAERLIAWHRAGRVSGPKAITISRQSFRLAWHLPLSLLPVFAHRMLTDLAYLKDVFANVVFRPVRLFFNADAREQWLRDMVAEGKRRHMLTEEDAETILSRIKEPFIQKYLKSLAVHVCTLPITQIVSLAIAGVYYWFHRDDPNAWAVALGIVAIFQVIPISPGSLVRGLYVVYLVIRERNFKDYNIAVFLGFFKYIGYLAFPIQMAYRYPALARFMAGHWATGAVHVIPVFGEHGALAEHAVFDLFYNFPLTMRRRLRIRTQLREDKELRWKHVPIVAGIGAAGLVAIDLIFWAATGTGPLMRDVWFAFWIPPLLAGGASALLAGGARPGKRVAFGALCGVGMGLIYSFAHSAIAAAAATPVIKQPDSEELLAITSFGGWLNAWFSTLVWGSQILVILSGLGAAITEVPEPRKPEDFVLRSVDAAEAAGEVEDSAPDLLDDNQADAKDHVGENAGDDVIEQDAPTGR